MICPCGSKKGYISCCGVYISGKCKAPNPEKLMRSRYTAFTQNNIQYIEKTMKKTALKQYQKDHNDSSNAKVKWVKLQVLSSFEEGNIGRVEFKAFFLSRGKSYVLYERSDFEKIDQEWFYVDGNAQVKEVLNT